MSRPIRDEMLGLDADLEAVRFPAASTVRARGRRRARRRMAAGAAAVTAAIALAGAGVAVSVPSSPQTTGAAPSPSCVTPSAPVDLTLPDDPAQLTLQVVDAAGDPRRSTEFAARLRAFGFTVSTGTEPAAGPTLIRFGPSAIGAAYLLEAYLDGPVTRQLVPDRAGRTVDLVLGGSSVRLRSVTEVNEALVSAGEPVRPAELCAPGGTGK